MTPVDRLRPHVVGLAKFASVGVINTAADYLVFGLLHTVLGAPIVPSQICGYGTGMISSFLLNGRWTFGSDLSGAAGRRALLKFTALNLGGLLLSTALVAYLSPLVGTWPAKVAVTIVLLGYSYAGSRLWVFR